MKFKNKYTGVILEATDKKAIELLKQNSDYEEVKAKEKETKSKEDK